jgi:FkbM family methyltransferase
MARNEQYINSPEPQLQEKILTSVFESTKAIVIFDIGACEGENSIRYARLFPNAEIYAFEPLPSNFEQVNKNILAYGADNVFPFQLCLADKEGTMDFHVSSGKPENAGEEDWDYGNKSSSLLSPAKTAEVHPWLKFEKSITVQTTTLKSFCNSQHINSIDFIHMDVQGAELMVLQGAQDFIHKINMVWLEVEAVELYKGQPLKRDIEKFMSAHRFIKLEDTVYTHAGDQFWARKEYIVRSKGLLYVYQTILFSALKSAYKKFRRRLLR